ncbi:MAG: hypothetical protein Q7T55_18195, partial [Solirubrobacteraceae bacterium]|nr:hypothetical protein [Solirubrobacteraceae bacterium]
MREATPVVSYVIRTFPKLSETFVVRELLALQQAGVPLEIWSLLPAGEQGIAEVPAAAPLLPFVRTAPRGPLGLMRMFGELFGLLGRRPVATARAIGWAVAWSIRERDARHAAALPYAAHLANHAAAPHLHAHFANTPATTAVLAGMLGGEATGDPGIGRGPASARGSRGDAEPRLTVSYTGHARDLWVMTSPAFLAEKTRRCTFAVSGTKYAVDQIRLALRTDGGIAPAGFIDPVKPSRWQARTGADRRRSIRDGRDRREATGREGRGRRSGSGPGRGRRADSGHGPRAGRAPLIEVVTNSVELPEIAGGSEGAFDLHGSGSRHDAGDSGGPAHDAMLVVSTARLVEKKGLDTLVRAVAQLA